MAAPLPELHRAMTSLGQALLIGLLIGFQRESVQAEKHPGFRDFLVIALTGGICGLLGNPWLTAPALLSVTTLVAVFHLKAPARTGITTELTAVATFCLGYLAAAPGVPGGPLLAIGFAIVVTAFLEAKLAIQRLAREQITETEFEDTLRFLAVIFIIYPLLPAGNYGPFEFFSPRKVWFFVILVSSITYLGYFLQKFLGTQKALALTAVVGGLGSTTAATMAFARDCAANPEETRAYGSATMLANAVQFPRVLVILWVMNRQLGVATAPVLLVMAATGALSAYFLGGRRGEAREDTRVSVRNPFRLLPALKFGALFTLILFLTKAAAGWGAGAVYSTSLIGGSVDVDSVVVSVSDLLAGGRVGIDIAAAAVLLALLSNAALKTILAFWWGTRRFGGLVCLGFLLMFAAGAAAWVARAQLT